MDIVNLLEYNDRKQLREWLRANHGQTKQCWVAVYRGMQRPDGACLPYIEVVEETLCVGWIDSTLKRIGDGRLAQRLSPRRKGSHWTELNIQRCHNLIEQGLMTEAGLQALKKASIE